MFDQYNDGFDDGFNEAINTMHDYLERIEIKLSQCLELSVLMNLMHNWKNTLSVEYNVRYTRELLDKIKNKYYLMRRYMR